MLVERSSTRARSKQKRQQQQKSSAVPPTSISSSTSLSTSAFNKLGLDLRSSLPSFSKSSTNSTSSSSHYEETVTEIEGIVMVTPLAIERYQLNGAIVKRAALPEVITAFLGTKIAGVGRVFLCGTQRGRVYVLKTDLLDSMLVFDTGV